MQGRRLLALTAALMGSAAFTPVTASAVTLPTCAQLATILAGNAFISQTASDNEGLPSPTASIVPATTTNAAYCKVHFQYSSKSGPAFGYAPGESQTIGIQIGLPLNSTDGGVPSNPTGGSWTAVNGAWNGKVENTGGGGNVGTIGATTGPTNGGYVGSSTDAGHNAGPNGNGNPPAIGNFAVIQATHQIDVGKYTDYAFEADHQEYLWALYLANQYYGQPAVRNYWSGCSQGGYEGLTMAEMFGTDFDGIYAGAPGIEQQEFWNSQAWFSLVNRDDVVLAGHSEITAAQFNNVVARAVAACDVEGYDTVADGVVDDPRQCTYDPVNDPTVLAAPAGTCSGTLCVDLVQAQAIDKIWDGPRNHFGQRFWYAFPKTVTINQADYILYQNYGPGGYLPTVNDNIRESAALDHRDLTFNPSNEYSTRSLAAANPFGMPEPIALEDEFLLADCSPSSANGCPENYHRGTDWQGLITNFYNKCKNGPGNCKLVSWQGNGDANIQWGENLSMIREVATAFSGKADFTKLGTWFRHYHAPGVAHCGNGIGASPVNGTLPDGQSQVFDDMVSWVETGIPPHSAGDSTKMGILGKSTSSAVGTRPLCPWPTTAIYSGSGPTNIASNYTCGGDLDAYPATAGTNNVVTVCQDIHTVYGQEDKNKLDYDEQGVTPGECEGANDVANNNSNQ
jgi:Tannase and feruloyl esterase